MDGKVVLGLLADILYIKGHICYDEFEALQEVRNEHDVYAFTERLLRGEFNVYKRGEHYAIHNE
jgi:hypothetical protein